MIVIMSARSSRQDVEAVQSHLIERGLQGHINPGTERIVIGVLGEIYSELQDEMEFMSGVSEVLRVTKPYKLASSEFATGPTVVEIGADGLQIGDGNFLVFAGPCAVESETQMLATAAKAREHRCSAAARSSPVRLPTASEA